MPPPRPAYLSGQYYHFYNRGHSRASIFREEDNYLFVLGKIKYYLRELDLAVIAYCLMPNHYHFLVRQDGERGAGLLPQRVFNSYTKAYNNRYTHSGSLFESSYQVSLLSSQNTCFICAVIFMPIQSKMALSPHPLIGRIPTIKNGSARATARSLTGLLCKRIFPSPNITARL